MPASGNAAARPETVHMTRSRRIPDGVAKEMSATITSSPSTTCRVTSNAGIGAASPSGIRSEKKSARSTPSAVATTTGAGSFTP